ncbi:MAG TPA: ABC transporter permease [Pseudonocardiaceae bacterium]|nr:ABC transporter permease [Pseudonocardiaceae bacterium]
MTSAYPRTLEDLIPQAQRVARELGALPSQNKLKAALHIRAERAKAVLQALKDAGFNPTAPTDNTADSSEPSVQVSGDAEAVEHGGTELGAKQVRRWPVVLLAAPAFVAIWSGWVGVGVLTGFGPVHPLPGIASGFTINSAITLPIGVETYAAYALRVWLAGGGPARARQFAKRSAIAAFVLGGLGQIAYHLMTAAHLTIAPWPITTAVSCLPVVVLGFGAALAHLQHEDRTGDAR